MGWIANPSYSTPPEAVMPDQESDAVAHPTPPHRGEVWPAAARWLTAILAVAALALLAWRGYGLSRWSLRPAPISHQEWVSPIDLNRAERADLRNIPGVGDKLAERIVAHREANGPFASLDDLRNVSGVGPATLTRLRSHLRVEPLVARGARAEDKDTPVVRKPPPTVKVDLNRATAEQLRTIPGLGPTMTTRILDSRREKPFRTVDDLRRVKGVGAKTLEKWRPYVEVGR